ncbi:ArdC-like ssDNA-binding domain-containing protein [Sporichthya polymorpha]|uniref:ArdC-like ssDNA-binding domain-containing protein n=1 Tax=Sporichthya polymorpha TaxID=35751 RepID=UPI000368EDDE|nr:ArdC-like ssDNA-binding domain-containing protein [Sporichthya polymorpha]
MRAAGPRRAAGEDRLAVAHARLVTAVEELATGDAWRRMLSVAARFPSYSANNVLLIGAQRSDATQVAGLRTWNALGRRVRTGEKGIAILAPCLYRARASGPIPDQRPRPEQDRPQRQGPDSSDDQRRRLDGSEAEPGAPAARLRGFRVVHVFDIAQTEGEPLPECSPHLLTGDAPRLLTDALAQCVEADGYRVQRGPCPGGANGITNFSTRTVCVRDDVADAQAAKTFAHELGHIRARHDTRFLTDHHLTGQRSVVDCRAQAEVEAESIAFLVAHSAGLASDAYSVPYLAGWSGGNTTVLRDTAARVIDTARGILTDLRLPEPAELDPPWLSPERIASAACTHMAEHDSPSPC